MRVASKTQREILFENPVNRDADAVFVRARLRFNRKRDGGLGDARGWIEDRCAFIAEGFSRRGFFQLRNRAHVACVQIVHGDSRLTLHHLHVLEALLRSAIEVCDRRVIFEDAGQDFEIGDASGEGVGKSFEHKNREWLGIGHFALDGFALVVWSLVAACFPARGRGRENVAQEIQDRVGADIVQRGTEQHRENALCEDCLAQAFLQIVDGKRSLVKKFLHQGVITFGDEFDKRFVGCFRFFRQIGGDFFYFGFAVAVRRVHQSFHCDEINHSAEAFLGADGQLDGNNAAAENVLQRVERTLKTGQLAVHPIQDEGARLIVLGGVVPGFFGDYLNASGCVYDDERSIRGDERGFCFVDEGGIAGSIEEIDFCFVGLPGGLPFGVSEAGIDGNFAGNFFFVPIGDGGAVGDFTQPRRHAGGEEQRRHELGFPRIAVAYNANVAYPFGCIGFHVAPRLEKLESVVKKRDLHLGRAEQAFRGGKI